MIAEPVFSIIQALPEKEYKRLLTMLNVEGKPQQKKSKVTGLTKAESMAKLRIIMTPKHLR